MGRKKKRGNQKPPGRKKAAAVPVANENEEAFLNFVDKNARRETAGLDEKSGGGGGSGMVDSDNESLSSSSSSSSSSGSDKSFHIQRSGRSRPGGVQNPTRKRGRPPKKQKMSDKAAQEMRSSSKRENPSEEPGKDPRYNEEQLKACLAVIKKVMEMEEAASFCAPANPASQDNLDVIDKPMDFGTVHTSLENGVKYMNAEDVYNDVQHIWEICLKYNKKGDYIVYLMKRVKKKFTKLWTAAGLDGRKLHRTNVPSVDYATRCSPHDDISVVDRVVGSLSYMQQDGYGMTPLQSHAPLTTHNQLYSFHQPQPQPSTAQLPPLSQLQPGTHSNYAAHSHLVGGQFQPNISGTIHSQSQVSLSGHRQPHQSHQHLPSMNQVPQQCHLPAGTDGYDTGHSHLAPSNHHRTKKSKRNKVSGGKTNHVSGNNLQQDNSDSMQPQVPPPAYGQSQVPPSSYGQLQVPPSSYGQHQVPPSSYGWSQVPPSSNGVPQVPPSSYGHAQMPPSSCGQPWLPSSSYGLPYAPPSGYEHHYQPHQPEPRIPQPPQLSQLHGGTDSNYAAHSHFTPSKVSASKHNKYASKSSGASVMSPISSKQQELRPSSYYPQQNQPSNGHSQPLPSFWSSMGQNGYAPSSPVNPAVADLNKLPAQRSTLSNNQPNELCRPQISTERPQPSQSLDSVDISSEDSDQSEEFPHGSSAGVDVEIPPVSSDSPSRLPSHSPSHPDQSQQPVEKTKKKVGKRGPTLCREMWDMGDGERIVVHINTLGQPIGPEAAKLSTFLGTVARNGEMAPLTFPDWFSMPDENKEKMWLVVQKKFEIDPLCKPWVLKSLSSRWRNWKAKLKADHYYPHKTDEERLKDRDERVLPDQWPVLVAYWNSEEAQLRCAKNKANRQKAKATHTSGQKSYARICEEEKAKRPDGKELTRTELYIKTHTRKDGQPLNEEAAEMIKKLREEEVGEEQNAHGSDDCGERSFQVIEEEIPTNISKKRSSRLRFGRGELMKMALEAKRSANEVVSKMVGKVDALEQKFANMEAQIATLASNLQNFFDMMGEASSPPARKQVHNHSNAFEGSQQARAHSSSSGFAIPLNEILQDGQEDASFKRSN